MVTCTLKVTRHPSRSLASPRSLASSVCREPRPSRVTPLESIANLLSPLELTLTRSVRSCPNLQQITPLESGSNLLSPLELTLTKNAPTCTNFRQITLLESIANLLSPLDLTLTKNAPVSPLESALTKSWDLKSLRIILLQKRVGEGQNVEQRLPYILTPLYPYSLRCGKGEIAWISSS